MITGSLRDAIELQLSKIESMPVTIASTRAASGGCINNAAHVTTSTRQQYFLKWNQNSPTEMFTREAEGLESLAGASSGLRVPRIYAIHEKTDGSIPSFLLMEELLVAPPTGTQHHYDEELGRGLAKLHSKHSERFGFLNDNYIGPTPQPNRWSSSWAEFFASQRIGYMLGLLEARNIDPDDFQLARKFQERLAVLLNHVVEPSLVHGDLWSGNCLRADDGAPAIIDPAVYYGDFEVDLAMMQLFGGFSARVFASYRAVKEIDAGFESRRDIYNVYHLLNHAIIFGGGYFDQAKTIMRRFV